MNEKKIGIVTVLYNSATVLDDYFETLSKQTYKNFVLYVVNNNSKDDSYEKANKLSSCVDFKVVLINEKENWGVAKGNNIGITQALNDECDYILLSNNDVVLEPFTIENLSNGLRDNNASMAVPKIYFYNTDLIWDAGEGCFDKIRCGTPHKATLQKDQGQFDRVKIANYAPTCFMLIEKHVFARIGMMDEQYFVYYDDSDFVWRATVNSTEKLVYIPTSRLWHKESTSTGGNSTDFSIFYMSRNAIYFARKHFNFLRLMVVYIYYIMHYVFRKSIKMSKSQRLAARKGFVAGVNLHI